MEKIRIQKDLDVLEEGPEITGLRLKEDKCKVRHLGKNNQDPKPGRGSDWLSIGV